jgi:hypothetical protein
LLLFDEPQIFHCARTTSAKRYRRGIAGGGQLAQLHVGIGAALDTYVYYRNAGGLAILAMNISAGYRLVNRGRDFYGLERPAPHSHA